MADITQRLGFDVSQGVSALNALKATVDNLTASLTKLNNVKLGAVGRSITRFTKNLDKVPASANNAATALNRLGSSVGFRGANESTNKLKDNLSDVGNTAERVGNQVRTTIGGAFVFSRATSGLRQIKQLLLDAADSANEFQLSVAEVQTIAGDASFDELAASIRKISLEFGGPDAKVAEAAYQAFSNQVVQTTGQLEAFLPIVEKLSRATGSDSADAVNALSSVLNTYGEEAGSAAEISDVLFKTVELGRTRFSEFANSLGTINSIAKEAGVSFTEVQAGIADITKTGTTTSVALTQLRGIFTKLVKPTDKLRAAFASFGAKDGPSFVKASGGVFQALQKLQQFADSSGVSIVELFGRVRAGQGALNILRDEGQSFISTFKELEEAARSGGAVTEEAFAKIADTDAFKANKAFNELSSRITEVGDAVLPVIGKFTELFNNLIPNTRSLTILIGAATAALILLAGAGAVAVISLTGIGAFLLPIAPLLLAIAVATGLGLTALNLQNQAIKESIELRTKDAKVAKEAADEQVKEQEKIVKAVEGNIVLVQSIIQDFFGDQLEDLKAFNDASIASFDGVIEAFADSRKAVLSGLGSFIKNADGIIDSSNKRARNALREIADIEFDKSLKGLNDAQVATKLLARFAETGALAREQFANAGQDTEKQREAFETRRLAKSLGREAKAAAAKTDSLRDDEAVTAERLKQLAEVFGGEKNFADQTKKLQQEAKDNIDAITQAFKDNATAIDGSTEKLKTFLSILTDAGEVKTELQLLTDMKLAVAEAKIFRELVSTDLTRGLAERTGGGEEEREGRERIIAGELEFETRSAASILSAENIITDNLFKVKLQQEGKLEDVKITLDTKEATAEFAALRLELTTKIAALNSEFILTPKIDAGGVVSNFFASFGRGLTSVVTGGEAAFLETLRGITEGAENFTKKQISDAETAIRDVQQRLDERIREKGITKSAAEAVKKDIESSKRILDGASTLLEGAGDAASNSISEVGQKAGEAATQTGNLATETGKVATAAGTISTNIAPLAGTLQAAVGPANQLANALERGARARATQNAFFGSVIHRQTGGFTRGQDRILTSTAPGEVVVNAAASRQFRAELTAMNAQQTPQFRETGGSVTNVGDINVNITTQDPGDIEGRPIARDLKRELRTRTSSL